MTAGRVVRTIGWVSTSAAALIFVCGMLPRSPFAEVSNGWLLAASTPAVLPFIALLVMSAQRAADPPQQLDPTHGLKDQRRFARPQRIRLRFPGRRLGVVIGAGVAVGISFFAFMGSYRGAVEPTADGRGYERTDKGVVLGPATRDDYLEFRTSESRALTGHFMLFGLIGLLGVTGPDPNKSQFPWRPTRAYDRSPHRRTFTSGRPPSRGRSIPGRPHRGRPLPLDE